MAIDELTKVAKQTLLEIFNEIVPVGGAHTPVLLALHATASSLWHAIQTGESDALTLPEGLPEESTEEERNGGLSNGVENGVVVRDV